MCRRSVHTQFPHSCHLIRILCLVNGITDLSEKVTVECGFGSPVRVFDGVRFEGLSDVEPLISLQDELNTRLCDRANRVTMQSFRMWLGKGIDTPMLGFQSARHLQL